MLENTVASPVSCFHKDTTPTYKYNFPEWDSYINRIQASKDLQILELAADLDKQFFTENLLQMW